MSFKSVCYLLSAAIMAGSLIASAMLGWKLFAMGEAAATVILFGVFMHTIVPNK